MTKLPRVYNAIVQHCVNGYVSSQWELVNF